MSNKLGPTGRFPRGKLSQDDEGEIQFGISSDPAQGLVRIDFGKPVAWLACPPELAEQMAGLLIKHAKRCRGEADHS